MRRFINLILLFLTVLVMIFGLAHKWLGHQVTDRVIAGLQNVYGGRVGVKDVHMGVNGTTLQGVELFEQDDPNGKPWLQVDKLRANVTLADAARGQVTPTEVNLDGANVTLRFDREGNLLTRLPTQGRDGDFLLPRLSLHDSQVRLRHADGSELVLQHVNATIERDEDNRRLVLRGDFAEERWGSWMISGTREDDGRLNITLTSAGKVRVTQAMLGQLPFLPESIWREVLVSGETAGKITVNSDPARPTLRYRVELEPRHTHVHISALDLDAEDASGRVVIEDGLVQLRGVKGLIAGGRVATEADLDFRSPPTKLDFTQLALEGLKVQHLPRSWNLPPALHGLLDATAGLHVDIVNGHARTHGTGTGRLRSMSIFGQPTEDSMRLTLRDSSTDRKRSAALLIDVQLRQLDLAELVARFKERPPVELSGQLAVVGQLLLPLDTIADPQTYQGAGSLEITRGRMETIALDRLRTDLTLQQGQLRFEGIKGEGPAVYVAGVAGMALAPRGDLRLDLELGQLDLAPLGTWMKARQPLRGTARGTLAARVAVEQWDQLGAWRGQAHLILPQLDIGDMLVRQGMARVNLQDGFLTLTEASAQLDGASAEAMAQLELTKPYAWQGRLELRQADLALLKRLKVAWESPQPVGGKLNASVKLQGTLQPWQLDTRGTATGLNLQIGKVQVPRLTLRWTSSADLLALDEIDAVVGQGSLRGSVRYPLHPGMAGQVNLTMNRLDAALLAKEIWQKPPVDLSGQVTGTVHGTILPEEKGDRPIQLVADLPGSSLRMAKVPMEQIQGTLSWRKPALAYHLEGRLAGGRLGIDGQMEIGKTVMGSGRLRLEKVALRKLSSFFHEKGERSLLGGQLEVNLPFQHNGDGVPRGNGRFTVTRMHYGDTDLSGDLRGNIQLLKQELLVSELSGELDQGSLRGKVGWDYEKPERRWFELTVENVEAAKLLSPWPSVGGQVQGRMGIQVHGKLGREWHGTGELRLQHGKVAGTEVSEWQLPVVWAYAPEQGRALFECRDSSAQVGGGRVNGQATLAVNGAVHVEGKLHFTHVDLRPLLANHMDNAPPGGKVSGKLEFASADLRAANNLTANLEATLAQAKSLDLPVFKQVLVLVGLAPSATFQKGEVRARLTGDVIRIERLSLDTGVVQLYARGTANTRGGLALDVTANTGRAGLTAGLLKQLGVPLVGDLGPRPLAAVRQLFSLQLLHLHVTGSVRSPTVQIQALPALPQEALRFFVGGILRLR